MLFRVIDTTTGREPDLRKIALTEKWAEGLIYCDMEGFLMDDDGNLALADECGSYVWVQDSTRFQVEWLEANDAKP